MPHGHLSDWRRLGLLSLLFLLIAPVVAGVAQTGTGTISGQVFDSFNWMPVTGLCATATSQADGSTHTDDQEHSNWFSVGDLPVGRYDLTVKDCYPNSVYRSRTYEDIDVLPFDPNGNSYVTVFLELQDAAMIVGRVVEDYGGYPLEGKSVEIIDAATDEIIKSTCTDREGTYQVPVPHDLPVQVAFGKACGGVGSKHKMQWYPFADTSADAATLTVPLGTHAVAHAALSATGGFVGTVLDPTGEIPGYGWKVVAKEGYYLSSAMVRQDGSFAVTRIGQDILLRVEPPGSWDDVEWGYLVDPDNPGVAATWDVGMWDLYDLGGLLLDRPPALAGRVVDTSGYPVNNALVGFYAVDEAAASPAFSASTDEQGWYVTDSTSSGRYTGVVVVDEDADRPHNLVTGTWLGDTPQRSQATILDLDGNSRGGIDFTVQQGKADSIGIHDYFFDSPETVTTDRERNGATAEDPIEISMVVETFGPESVGTHLDRQGPVGFVSFGFGASVTHDPIANVSPQRIEILLEQSLLAEPLDSMQVIWNGRRLAACSVVAPPCIEEVGAIDRGDILISADITDGGVASFVWGPSFLDTGVSIFLNDIEWLANEGVTKGCAPPINDLFCPKDQVTRGQMAAFLSRFLGLTDRGGFDFADDDGSVFEADIERLAAAGITKGCNPPANNRFCPNDPVTREQMAAFLTRALRLPAPADGTEFSDDDGSIFEDSIGRLATAGITRGCNPPTNDKFCPSATVTREQMAAFLHRADDLRP
ncbi:MAG: S-layer homology domain-containing protein [bacterium]|nr:S-layer homology domain-containing protein [bacterium]